MTNSVFEISIILVLLVGNGLFAMAEIAVVSARKVRLQQLAESGNAKARTALELANAPNDFLATVQVGITLVGILAGAFGGATLASEIALLFDAVPVLRPYSGVLGVGVVVVAITYLSLVIGELVPKRLALGNAERIATRVAQPMRLLSQVARPVVALLNISSTFVIRLLGVKPSAEPQVTEEEIRVLIEQGTELGVFEESEQDMIESILRLGDRRVEAFMTPRTKIVALELEDAPEESKQKIINGHHSHYPVVQDSLDNVIGMVRTKDLVVQALQQQPLEVQAVMQSPLFVPESMTALEVLDRFKVEGMHVALITDEYGGIQGMVTQNDILEAIVDDLPGSDRLMQPQIVQRADGSWLVDGLLHIDKLKELLDVEMLPDEEEEGFQTVGGFMVSQFNDIPRAGQVFDWDRFNFEVVDMDGRRVDKILITGHQVAPAESAEGDG